MTKQILNYRELNVAINYATQKTADSYLKQAVINEGQAESTSAKATLYVIACLALYIRNHTSEDSKIRDVNKATQARLIKVYHESKMTPPCERNLRMRIQAARYVLNNAKADSLNDDKALNEFTTFCEKFSCFTDIVKKATKKKSPHHSESSESEKFNKRIDSLFKDIAESATLTTKDKLSLFSYIKDRANARLAGMDDKPNPQKQPAKTTSKKQPAKKAA